MTDARGATTTFGYNNRHLVTGITYGVPGGVTATSNVSFGYDAAGNRTSMTDGLGSASYVYNSLSQMTSETRTFTGVGSFTLTYGSYNLAGELTSMTNPWGAQAGYNYDKLGRPTAVSGSGYAGVSSYVNSIGYRTFGMKQMGYANGRTLSLSYDNRLRMTGWDIPGVMGWNYAYNYFNENSGRVTYAQNRYDSTLDRSYDYDQVGRLISAHTGIEARAHIGIGPWNGMDGPYSQDRGYDQFGNATHRVGWGGYQWGGFDQWYNFANNQLIQDPGTGAYLQYDAAGNLTNDGNQSFSYDATGQQTSASGSGLTQSYDGDRLRVAKTENGVTTYYLRSTLLGGQVAAEINSSGSWTRGFVYLGGQMVAIQSSGVYWTFQDPITKSQRVTDGAGNVVSTIDLDPWGGETWRSSNQAFQPHRYTTYERDNNGGDEAMMRRYQSYWNRFSQPDPYGGSYDFTDPQSFNRYSHVQNDPVNFVDPSGLDKGDQDPNDHAAGKFGYLDTEYVTVFDGGGGEMIPIDPWEKMGGPWWGGEVSTGGPGGPQQNPSPVSVRQIIKDIKKQDAMLEQAEKEFQDCVNNDPKVVEYKKRLAKTSADWSILYGFVGHETVHVGTLGAAALGAGNIFTVLVASIFLPDFIYADQNKASKELRDVVSPVAKECAKQINQKYGLTLKLKI